MARLSRIREEEEEEAEDEDEVEEENESQLLDHEHNHTIDPNLEDETHQANLESTEYERGCDRTTSPVLSTASTRAFPSVPDPLDQSEEQQARSYGSSRGSSLATDAPQTLEPNASPINVEDILSNLRRIPSAAGAVIFRQKIELIDQEGKKIDNGKSQLWLFAQVCEYHTYLGFNTFEEMRIALTGPAMPPENRAMKDLRAIRKHWAEDFHVSIDTWHVPASEKLCRDVLRIARATTLDVFAERIHEIMAKRISAAPKRGGRHDPVVMASDVQEYEKQYGRNLKKRGRRKRGDVDLLASDGEAEFGDGRVATWIAQTPGAGGPLLRSQSRAENPATSTIPKKREHLELSTEVDGIFVEAGEDTDNSIHENVGIESSALSESSLNLQRRREDGDYLELSGKKALSEHDPNRKKRRIMNFSTPIVSSSAPHQKHRYTKYLQSAASLNQHTSPSRSASSELGSFPSREVPVTPEAGRRASTGNWEGFEEDSYMKPRWDFGVEAEGESHLLTSTLRKTPCKISSHTPLKNSPLSLEFGSTLPSSPKYLPNTGSKLKVNVDPDTNPIIPEEISNAIKNLSGKGMLNDDAVNTSIDWVAACASINTISEPEIVYLNSHFFRIDSTEQEIPDTASKTVAQQKDYCVLLKDPSRYKFLAPIHHRQRLHWSLVLINFKEHSIDHYDSWASSTSSKSVFTYIESWMRRIDGNLEGRDITHTTKACAQQTDAVSCGIFTITFAAALLHAEPIPQVLNSEAILNLRQQYCESLRLSTSDNSPLVTTTCLAKSERRNLFKPRPITQISTDTSALPNRIFPAMGPRSVGKPEAIPLDLRKALEQAEAKQYELRDRVTRVEGFVENKSAAKLAARNEWQKVVQDTASASIDSEISDSYVQEKTTLVSAASENHRLAVLKEGKAKAGEHSYKDVLAKQERLVAALKDLIDAEEHGEGNIRELNSIMEEEQENDV